MTLSIRFPDASIRRATERRATPRLLTHKAGVWSDGPVRATYEAENGWRIEMDGDAYFLRHIPDHAVYAGGAWPSAVATGFILRRGANGAVKDGVILEVWDVADAPRGPGWMEGVDG